MVARRLAHGSARKLGLLALAASLVVHVAVAGMLSVAPHASKAAPPPEPVEFAVVAPPPVPPPPPSETPPAPPPARVEATVRARRPPAKPVAAPPPPSHTPPPPEATPPQPVVGVTPESVTDAPADTAVAVGNTVGAAAAPVAARAPTPYSGGAAGGSGMTPFAPVPEGFVKQWPKTLNEVRAPYPEEARRMDVSGTVRLRVGIDEEGKVREVKVIKGAGYGLDEAATKAMWRFKFSPALGQDGRPVAFRINYDYTFTPGR